MNASMADSHNLGKYCSLPLNGSNFSSCHPSLEDGIRSEGLVSNFASEDGQYLVVGS